MPRAKNHGIKYSKKVANYILTEIEKGRSLTSICAESTVPSYRAVQAWVRENKYEFTKLYRQARETQLNLFIDQMNDIADAPPPVAPSFVVNDEGAKVPLEGGDRKLWVNAEIQRRRLKVDTIKFQAAKLAGVMGYHADKGLTVVGDTVNILNYASAPDDGKIVISEGKVKEVNFIEVTNED